MKRKTKNALNKLKEFRSTQDKSKYPKCLRCQSITVLCIAGCPCNRARRSQVQNDVCQGCLDLNKEES